MTTTVEFHSINKNISFKGFNLKYLFASSEILSLGLQGYRKHVNRGFFPPIGIKNGVFYYAKYKF